MGRKEFTTKTRKQALLRSNGLCEAVGKWYGLEAGKRCNSPLSYGVEYDHVILDANSKDNSLENCAAVCIKCHNIKTRTHDTPTAAKTVRQQNKHTGVKKPKQSIASRGFDKTDKPRKELAPLPRRQLYKEVGA